MSATYESNGLITVSAKCQNEIDFGDGLGTPAFDSAYMRSGLTDASKGHITVDFYNKNGLVASIKKSTKDFATGSETLIEFENVAGSAVFNDNTSTSDVIKVKADATTLDDNVTIVCTISGNIQFGGFKFNLNTLLLGNSAAWTEVYGSGYAKISYSFHALVVS